VLVQFVYLVACRLFALALLLARSDRSKELELLVLRHELSILRRQAQRPRLTESDRLLPAALSRVTPRRSWRAFPVAPETLLRWHRRIVANSGSTSRRRWCATCSPVPPAPERAGSTATHHTLQVRRRDLLGGLLHEYEAAA
jgi:hypothetical protein